MREPIKRSLAPAISPGDLLTRTAAAEYLSERWGYQLKARAMERQECPYRLVSGRSLYLRSDLDRYAAEKLAASPRRRKVNRPSSSHGAAAEQLFAA